MSTSLKADPRRREGGRHGYRTQLVSPSTVLWYRLTRGRYAGRYIYIAEQITQLARIRESVKKGQIIARYARKGTCIEIGWATANGRTLAQATTGYKEGQATAAGRSFARFLTRLGAR